MEAWDGHDRRHDAVEVAKLANRLDSLQSDVGDIKVSLRDLASAVNRLAIIEERQAVTISSVERAFKAIHLVEDRLMALERTAPNNARIGAWVDRAVFALIGVAVMFMFDQWRGR